MDTSHAHLELSQSQLSPLSHCHITPDCHNCLGPYPVCVSQSYLVVTTVTGHSDVTSVTVVTSLSQLSLWRRTWVQGVCKEIKKPFSCSGCEQFFELFSTESHSQIVTVFPGIRPQEMFLLCIALANAVKLTYRVARSSLFE